MSKFNPKNERIKRQYFTYLKQAHGYSEATVDAVAKALARFETDTKYRDFKAYHFEQAIAFKSRLEEQRSQETGKPLSKATTYATLAHLKRFFTWLAGQPGYKSCLKYSDADYFRLSNKGARVATAHRESRSPTMEQVRHVIGLMPNTTDVERRDRALVAFILLTGARDGAVASMKLRHVDLIEQSVFQDAREVKTKNSKTFTTTFFPVGDEIRDILVDWVTWLRAEKLWGWTTHFSLQHTANPAPINSFRPRACPAQAGRVPGPSAEFSARHLPGRAWNTSTLTACAKR